MGKRKSERETNGESGQGRSCEPRLGHTFYVDKESIAEITPNNEVSFEPLSAEAAKSSTAVLAIPLPPKKETNLRPSPRSDRGDRPWDAQRRDPSVVLVPGPLVEFAAARKKMSSSGARREEEEAECSGGRRTPINGRRGREGATTE